VRQPPGRPSFAFPSSKVLPTLSQSNTRRTSARCSPVSKTTPDFALSPDFELYPSRYGGPLLLPTSQSRPSNSLPYGWPAMPRAWRSDGLSTFRAIAHLGQLRCSLYAGGSSVPCRQLDGLHPGHACKHKGACLRPTASHRSVCFADAAAVQLVSPYCPALALNRMGFPEGFACRHLNPIRYIVGEAPHPVISATATRSPRVLVGTHQVSFRQIRLCRDIPPFQTHTITQHRVAP